MEYLMFTEEEKAFIRSNILVTTKTGVVQTNGWAAKRKWWSDSHSDHMTLFDKITEYWKSYKEERFKTIIEHILSTKQPCVICGALTYRKTKGGDVSCSKDCSRILAGNNTAKFRKNNPDVVAAALQKAKKTCIDRYGVESVFNIPSVRKLCSDSQKLESTKNKRKQTCIERFGLSTNLSLPENRAKSEILAHTPEARSKRKQTCLDRYGVENNLMLPEVIEKNKIGSHTEEVNSRRKKTVIERFGTENYNNREKARITRKENLKSGVIQKNLPPNAIRVLESKELLDDMLKEHTQKAVSIKIGVSQATVSIYAREYGLEYSRFQSEAEREIAQYILTIDEDAKIICNSRKIIGQELDIFLPDYNLAIEFNGLFWHSTTDVDKIQYAKTRHLVKTDKCEELGISLLQILDTEWENKKNIWKSVIRCKMNKINRRLFARNLNFAEVKDKEIITNFEKENHLQGHCKSSRSFGLYDNEELVCLASFSRDRFGKTNKTELVRFCSKLNTIIVGGMSKILSHVPFVDIVSYANRRWSSGNVYNTIGFKKTHTSKPNYSYIERGKYELLSRQKFQKHKLPSILDNFDKNKTEAENMLCNNYRIIYDCGNIVYNYQKRIFAK